MGSPEWEVEPVLHGRTREGRDFTLLAVGGANLKGPFHEVREVYRPEMALAGCHTGSDEFSEAWCDFDYLDAWVDPPSTTNGGDQRDEVSVRLARVGISQAGVGDTALRLVSGVQGTSGGSRVDLARWTSFAIEPPEPRPARDFINTVRALQDLLMFCIGRPVRLTSLRLMPVELADPREGTAEAFFSAVQPAASKAPTFADVENYTAPTILSLRKSPVSVEHLLTGWFDLWERYRDVLTLLLVPLYAPFMSSEHGFASTFQSAEALHDLVLPTRDVSKIDHRRRLEAVTAILQGADLDESVVEWVRCAANAVPEPRDCPSRLAPTAGQHEPAYAVLHPHALLDRAVADPLIAP